MVRKGKNWLNKIFVIKCAIYIYVTGEMVPSGGFVSPGPNLTGEMEPGMNTNI